ncbi:MAG TPA: ABC transporter ATP-binding protein [Rectinemataceae bacterium]|nr:ABC transporter ATP-binding protein [Rectinemataceae bacterium]
MTNGEILAVRDLQVHYVTDDGVAKALNGVNLSLARGETLGLVGETGAGKTTTALAIMNLIAKPQGRIIGGEVRVEGTDILATSERDMEGLRGQLMSMIFQDPMTALNPVLSVGDQIGEVIGIHQGLSKRDSSLKASDMLRTVGIDPGRAGEYPHQFSGGMKQRVGIAMALACHPKLLIADEPTTALDVTIQAQVLALIGALKKELTMSVLLITHDLGIVAQMCDDVAIMYAGRIVEFGSREDIFRHHRHPYTEGLFNSLPRIGDRKSKLKPIRGLMPDPFNLEPGCPFAERCDHAMERCRSAKPEPRYFGDRHFAECHLFDPGRAPGVAVPGETGGGAASSGKGLS